MEEHAKEKWTRAKPLFENDAVLFHKLAVSVGDDPRNAASRREAFLLFSGGNENAAPVFFCDVWAIVLEFRRNAQEAKLKSRAEDFYREFFKGEKEWLRQAYDLELLRYAKAFDNLILCTNEVILQKIADRMGLRRV